jgi:tetratricopeptide (TPR) repeat protein
LLFCLAMTFHVVRSAVVAAPGPSWLALARQVWPGHPRVLTASIMRDVGTAAARGAALPPSTADEIETLSERNALAAEPFLVLGAQAYQRRELARAEKLLLEARRRGPRSAAARYLLGSLYIETGRLDAGLRESAALARLVPGAAAQLAPALAQYLSAPGGVKQTYDLLKAHPDLAPPLFNQLAADPRNADLLVGLSSAVPAGESTHVWQEMLISALLKNQYYAKAWSVWARLNGQNAAPPNTVHDAGFRDDSSAPPFNWQLSRSGGLIERRNGSLHVLYFGRDEVTLVRQVLLLRPGAYELAMDVSGSVNASHALRWEISCLPGKRNVLRSPLRQGSASKLRARFVVPSADCEAQDLRLEAAPGDFPGTSDFSIANLKLARAA